MFEKPANTNAEASPTASAPQQLTEYDVFLGVAGRKGITKDALAKSLWLNDDIELSQRLDSLVAQKLVICDSKGQFLSTHSAKADSLFALLSFALAYNYDYNLYLGETMRNLLRDAYHLQYIPLNALPKGEEGRALLFQLAHDSLVVIFRYQPFMVRIVKGYFFDSICAFFEIKPHKRLLERKLNVDMFIMEKLMAQQKNDLEQIARGALFFYPGGAAKLEITIPKIQKILKYDIIPENPELFGPKAHADFVKAEQTMRYYVQERRQLTLELVRDYHHLAMFSDQCSDDLRTHQVEVRNNPHFKTCAPKDIKDRLVAFQAEYRRRQKKARTMPEILSLAAYVYNEVLAIHPFEDGNSRTAILLLSHVLLFHNAGFERIPASYDYRFIQTTKGAKKRDDSELYELLKEVYLAVINKQELAAMAGLT